MITVNYLTFNEVDNILKIAGNKFGFETALQNAFSGDSYIAKAGELIDDYLVHGERQYLVNHDFADKLSINYDPDEVTVSQCLNLKSTMENWLTKKAEWYSKQYHALESIATDNKTITESSSNSETSGTGSTSTTTDQDTSGTSKNTTDAKNGNERTFLDTPETNLDYTAYSSHITNSTKDKGYNYNETTGSTSGTLDSTVTGSSSSTGSSSGSGTTTTTSPTATLKFDRMREVIWPLYESFRKRWAIDATLLGEGF